MIHKFTLSDHPEANGRKAEKGEVGFTFSFLLEGGDDYLEVRMGQKGRDGLVHRFRQEEADDVREALKPVRYWFQSDEHPELSTLDILREVVEEFQSDRQFNLAAAEAIDKFLKACTCEMIQHHGMGPAFDAAQKAMKIAGGLPFSSWKWGVHAP